MSCKYFRLYCLMFFNINQAEHGFFFYIRGIWESGGSDVILQSRQWFFMLNPGHIVAQCVSGQSKDPRVLFFFTTD